VLFLDTNSIEVSCGSSNNKYSYNGVYLRRNPLQQNYLTRGPL